MASPFSRLGLLAGLILLAPGCDAPTPTPSVRVVGPISARPDKPKPSEPGVGKPNPRPEVQPEVIPPEAVAEEKPESLVPARLEEEEPPKPEKPPEIPAGFKPLNEQKTLFLSGDDKTGRAVHLRAKVVLREGALELFLCKRGTKEHESILACDVDARQVHAALLACKAVPGKPVQFVNAKTMREDYRPATGEKIVVELGYHFEGKWLTKPAQHWVANAMTGKEMAEDWVFAGSQLFKDPEEVGGAKDYYLANNGPIISISNFPEAMLELPVKSSREASQLGFKAAPARIPPVGTEVLVTLRVKK